MSSEAPMPSDPVERPRKHERVWRRHVEFHVSLTTAGGTVVWGIASDLGTGGLRFTSSGTFREGQFAVAEMALPNGEIVRAHVEVVRRDPAAMDGLHSYGLRFHDLGAAELAALFEFMGGDGAPPG